MPDVEGADAAGHAKATVRFPSEDEHGFVFFGDVLYQTGHYGDTLIVRQSDLAGCVASELESLLAPHTEPGEIYVTSDSQADYDEDLSPALGTIFDVSEARMKLRVDFRIPGWAWDAEDSDSPELGLRRLVGSLLELHGLTFLSEDLYSGGEGRLYFDYEPRDRDLGDLVVAGEDIRALIDATRGAGLTMITASALIQSGRIQALVGQPEGSWFDAKKSPYDLNTLGGKVSLAESVARFCNAHEGGLVVFGLETSVSDGLEVVSKLTPMPLDLSQAQRYRKIIDQHVYPFPERLKVVAIPSADNTGMFVLVEIPQQPDYNKPYLVAGAIVEDKAHGAFISVVQRRDDGSEPLKASTIHAWIATGRALIQRGELPNDDAAAPNPNPNPNP